MHGVHRLAHKRGDGVVVADVYVLDVELDSVEMIVAAEGRELADGVRSRRGNSEYPVDGWLIEARVHDERNQLDALLSRGGDDAWVHCASDGAGGVHHEYLWRD